MLFVFSRARERNADCLSVGGREVKLFSRAEVARDAVVLWCCLLWCSTGSTLGQGAGRCSGQRIQRIRGAKDP